MKTTTPAIIEAANYTFAMRTMLPGIVLGTMCLAASFAASSTAETEQQLLERNLQSQDADVPYPRFELLLQDKDDTGSDSVALIMAKGLALFDVNSGVAPLEQITLEVPMQIESANGAVRTDLHQCLLELLARRADALELQLTIRTAPRHVDAIAAMLQELKANSGSGDNRVTDYQIAMAVDPELSAGTMFIDVLRSVRLVPQEAMP